MDDYLAALAGEAAVRALIADQHRAICAKNVDALMRPYAPEFVAFDAIPPFRTVGPDAWRQVWAGCLPHVPDAFQIEARDLHVAVSGDAAFAHWMFRIEDHRELIEWERQSQAARLDVGLLERPELQESLGTCVGRKCVQIVDLGG